MKNEKQFNKAWWRRKAGYVVVAVIGLVLTGLGVVTQDQVDAFTASPLLATAIGLFAAAKTNAGSDSTVTAQDVADAASVDADTIADRLFEKINTYGAHAAEAVKDRAEQTVEDYYAAQRK